MGRSTRSRLIRARARRDRNPVEGTETLLRCEDCGVESDVFATRWLAFILNGVEGESDTEVLIFCPECAERELEPSGWDE